MYLDLIPIGVENINKQSIEKASEIIGLLSNQAENRLIDKKLILTTDSFIESMNIVLINSPFNISLSVNPKNCNLIINYSHSISFSVDIKKSIRDSKLAQILIYWENLL